jgi:hypothetical protein
LEKTPCAMCPAEFLTHYNSFYPLPQKQRWTNVQPHSDLLSSMILTLRGQRLPLRQWTIKLDKRPGSTGPTTTRNAALTPGCAITQSNPSKLTSLPLGLHGNFWERKPGWTSICGKGLALCGIKLAFGWVPQPQTYIRLQRVRRAFQAST